MKNALIFLLVSIYCINISAQNLDYKFRRYSPVSGFSFNGVTCIQEDKNGFIWIGGGNNIFFYDGIYLKNYSKTQDSYNQMLSSHIFDIFKDSKDILWLCTSLGLMYFNSNKDKFYPVNAFIIKSVEKICQISEYVYIVLANGKLYVYNSKQDSTFLLDDDIDNVTTFYKQSDNDLIVGTSSGKIFMLNISDSKKSRLIYKGHFDRINSICRDNKWLYIGYENSGIEVINVLGEKVKSYVAGNKENENSLPDNNVRTVVNRGNGEIWIATYDGLAILFEDKFTVFNNVNSSLPSSSVYDIYIDTKGNIWIGTWSGGLVKYSPSSYHFGGENVYLNNKTKFGVVTSFTSSINEQRVWIGTENNGLYLYNHASTKFENRIYPLPFHIKTMIRKGEKILIGAVEGIFIFDERTNDIEDLPIKSFSTSDPIISSMFINNNNLYIATRREGILKYNLESKEETVYSFENNRLGTNFVWQIFVDAQDNIYACTDSGFYVKGSSQDFFHKIEFSDCKNGEVFYCISSLNYEELLLGTQCNGVFIYNVVTGLSRPLSSNNLLKGFEIYSLISNGGNRIWASTNDGIISFSSEGKDIFKYTETDGIIGRQFHPLAGFIFNDGTAFWGSTVGFNYINISSIKYNSFKTNVLPIEIKINNKPLALYEEVKYSSVHVPDIRYIELPYFLNNLSFRISANNLLNPEKNKLKYRLEGYQNDWTVIPQSENIVFTQVPPGKYTLCVFGANNDMLWGDNELRISVLICPPFYATWYAYLFYIVLSIVILFFIYRNIKFRIKALQEISSERNQSRINKVISEERTKFFMNISHELRTPLNLIVAPMKILMEQHFDKDTKYHLDVIYRNTERLRHLTDQILDFRLLEMHKMKVNKKNVDLVSLCKDIIGEFDFYVKKNKVSLKFQSDALMRIISCDQRMIEKAIYNLLSNAFKYTENGPVISIELKKVKLTQDSYNNIFYVGNNFEGTVLQIIVSDNGKGIDKNNFGAVFERFTTYHYEDQDGSGIGLHLCKEYVTLHGGNIMLKSELGIGSAFIVSLPFVNDSDEQNVSAPIVISKTEIDHNSIEEENIEETSDINSNKKTVLLVDENDDEVYYLKKSLSSRYRCLIAKNGKIGLDMAINVMPDIILMDYMIPVMNGVDCTKAIRNNVKVKNIPVIIISGVVDAEIQKRAVSVGVDVFLTKPVDEGLLIEHIGKLLDKSMIVNENYLIDKTPKVFIERIDYYLEKNISDPNFDVEQLSACMNISRSSLFRKIKSETGYNISEYIKEKRLKVAIELIKSGIKNVEELSVCCGFNSSSYFCKCFKNKYGVSPKEYIKINL